MDGSWFFDKNFNGVPDDFFDDAIRCFDFPLEDVEANEEEEDWEAKFKQLEPPPSNVLVGLSSGFCNENNNVTMKAMKASAISQYEASQLTTVETSSKRSIPLHYDNLEGKYLHQFRTSSPVSVLETPSSSVENPMPNPPRFVMPVKRPRSKRSRSQRSTFPFISTFYAFKRVHSTAASESESESYIDEKTSNSSKRRQKKKKNLMLLSCKVETTKPSPSPQHSVENRKCTHCGVTKTPQWREGPMGPKTLCNACGVRYRSGRLLPEYRPAASPTFVPSLHSNSHRKVLEMRKNVVPVTSPSAMDGSTITDG